MLRRTVEVSRQPAHLCLRHEQLVLKQGDDILGTLPCEDVGMVVVDHPGVTYSHGVLARLMDAGAVVVVCGPKHLPCGLLLPMPDHTEVVWRLDDQVRASLPSKKRLWQQVVKAKILAQAANLAAASPSRARLMGMAAEVRSGDTGAHESQAAKVYWQAWLTEVPEAELPPTLRAEEGGSREEPIRTANANPIDPRPFRRVLDGDGLNALLNYGYAIVRAAIARAIVAAGLHPAFGIQHRNRSNAFCLADDLIEPLRPIVDRRARRLWFQGQFELDQPTKASLLEVLDEPIWIGDRQGPLQVALHHYTASYLRCLRKEDPKLAIPGRKDDHEETRPDSFPCTSAVTDPCGS